MKDNKPKWVRINQTLKAKIDRVQINVNEVLNRACEANIKQAKNIIEAVEKIEGK